MTQQQHHFNLFADYYQFYLQDEGVDGNLAESWTEEAVDRLLAIAPGTIGVGTVRNMTVPVDVEVAAAAPDDDFADWDQVNECSIEIESGKLVVAGCTDYFPEAARLSLPPGTYRARIYYGGLTLLSEDGLDGDDRYRVILWPAEYADLVILKQRANEDS